MASDDADSHVEEATAVVWKNGALVSYLQSDKITIEDCCNDTWLLLQSLCASSNKWCLDKRKDFDLQCWRQMASFQPQKSRPDRRWHSFFLPPVTLELEDEGEEAMVKWKRFANGAWEKDSKVYPFLLGSSALANEPTFEATIHSRLSRHGGMHRLLYHDITVQCPEEVKVGSSYQATMTALVFVTQHFFVDIDDAFSIPTQAEENATPSLPSSRERIDIEQPVFVSPQHVLPVNVALRGTCGDTSSQSFATKLHIRYPPLTPTGHLQVTFPSPLLYSGNLVTSRQEYKLDATKNWEWQPPISVNVATGFESDGRLVGFATLLASIIGSFMLLRSMSKVSRWN